VGCRNEDRKLEQERHVMYVKNKSRGGGIEADQYDQGTGGGILVNQYDLGRNGTALAYP
jgi:hypothetical protein